jgi:GNAT superfamily N-acetyltransferase
MSIRIEQAISSRQIRAFIRFRHHLYQGDPNYIPELNWSERIFLGPKNPFFRHSRAAYFLAFNGTQVAGRVAAIYNTIHLERYKDATGFFGFFDAVDNQEVCDALLHAAGKWLASQGLARIMGPENFTTNHAVGILTAGFGEPPVVQMPYNRPYYERLLRNNGMTEQMELHAYRFEQVALPLSFMERAQAAEARLERQNIRIRPVNFSRFSEEMEQLRQVYNAANEGHWGFVPLTVAEFRFLADDLRKIVQKENVLLAEKDGQLIGYMVTVPDVNQILRKIPEGRLFPFGWTKLLARPRINGARLLILGVLPAFRRLGIDSCFYARTSRFFTESGIKWTEAGYVMGNNLMMNRIIRNTGGEPAKTYKVFARPI